MLEKTGTPSDGHPTPVKKLQFGDENRRVPTMVKAGEFDPPATTCPLGKVKFIPAGIAPAGTKNGPSSRNWPQVVGLPPAKSSTALGLMVERFARSRQVCGLP